MKKILLYENKIDCCGCGACKESCDQKAIKMIEDEYGFLYPNIDESLCIGCGKCKKVCAFQSSTSKNTVRKSYAAISKDSNLLSQSSSGGIFATVASHFIDEGGWVCGACLSIKSNKIDVRHIISNDKCDLVKMQGSKYVQSDITDVIPKIKDMLKDNQRILFSGTPCQVDAIKRTTNNNPNLFTIDLICHGVPSQKMFNDFLNNYIHSRQRLKDVVFRDRTKTGYTAKITVSDGKKEVIKYNPEYLMSVYHLFLESINLRDNCYQCKYADASRCGDLTLGDYWGIKTVHKKEYEDGIVDDRSWSCILANTSKGLELVNKTKNKYIIFESILDNVKFANEQLKRPSKKPKHRKEVMELYSKRGYEAVEKWYRKRMGIKFYGLLLRHTLFKR